MIAIKGIRAQSTDLSSIMLSNVRMLHVMSDTTAVTWNAPARYRGDLGHMGYFALTLNNLLDNNSISHFLALKGHLTFLLHH